MTFIVFMQAITGDSVALKFEKARCALADSLRRVEDIVPQTIGVQVTLTEVTFVFSLSLSLSLLIRICSFICLILIHGSIHCKKTVVAISWFL